jgi:Fic family protein
MGRYIWQRTGWPQLTWRSEELLVLIGRVRHAQGGLSARAERIGLEAQAEVLVDEAVTTAAIEGEKLARDSVRSSVAHRLGLPTAGLPATERHIDGLVEMLMDATQHHGVPLSAARVFGWHAALFPTGYSGMRKITVAGWRAGTEPMQVVSGPIGRERVHFLAPPAGDVPAQMHLFFAWWQESRGVLEGLVRAGLAHLRFVTIHPFEDGNGRIARALTDMALAQDERRRQRLYSMSAQIVTERRDYYDVLERTQKGSLDVSDWLQWFLGCLERAIRRSDVHIDRALHKARFWETYAGAGLNQRQQKVTGKLLDAGPGGFEGGLTNRKYVAMTRTSRETAKRDIVDLVRKGILVRNVGGGRSVSYDLAWVKKEKH